MSDLHDTLTEYGAEWRAMQPPFAPDPIIGERRGKRLPAWSVAALVALAVLVLGGVVVLARPDAGTDNSRSVRVPAGAPAPDSVDTAPARAEAPTLAPATPIPTGPTTPSDLAKVYADAIASRDLGRQRFGDAFGGLGFTDNQSHIDVYLTVLDPQIEAGIIGDADPGEYTFHLTHASETDQAALRDRIVTDTAWQEAAGITVNEIAPVLETGTVRVGVGTLTPQIRQALEERYGAANITVTEEQPSTAT